MNRNPVSIAIGVILLVVFLVLLFVFQVRQSEVAIVTTFGQPTGTPKQAGPHLRLPWPIQKVYKFDQRRMNRIVRRFSRSNNTRAK